MRILPVLYLGALACLCMGCQSFLETETLVATSTLQAKGIVTSTYPAIPTETLMVDVTAIATMTPTPTVTEKAAATFLYQEPGMAIYTPQCIAPPAEAIPPGFLSTGPLILSRNDNTFLWTVPENRLEAVPSEFSDFGVLSPDGKWHAVLAINDSSDVTPTIKVASVDRKQQWAIPVDTTWKLVTWLTNDRLMLSTPGGLVNVNPFNGQVVAEAAAPSLESLDTVSVFRWRPKYDPTLTRVLYLMTGSRIVLWDVQSGQELWAIQDTTPASEPIWSPDGSIFAVVAGQPGLLPPTNLQLRDRDGKLIQAFDFQARALKWSPNGQYIAGSTGGLESTLVMIDVVTGRTVDYCVPVVALNDYDLIWSPDSRQVAVTAKSEDGLRRYVVIDLATGQSAQLPQGYGVTGWAVTLP